MMADLCHLIYLLISNCHSGISSQIKIGLNKEIDN